MCLIISAFNNKVWQCFKKLRWFLSNDVMGKQNHHFEIFAITVMYEHIWDLYRWHRGPIFIIEGNATFYLDVSEK